MSYNKYVLCFVAAALIVCFTTLTYGHDVNPPVKKLWSVWEKFTANSNLIIDHRAWQTFLDKYVSTNKDGISLVDYKNVTEADLSNLNQYLWQMSKINLANYNRNEQLAYWLNAYNALVVKIILTHYPTHSIREVRIMSGIFSTTNPWHAVVFHNNGADLSLNDIQNSILRPIWSDYRINFALCNATIGGPNLPRTVFSGKNINQQLNTVTRNYINSLRAVQVIQGHLVTSELLAWYQDDFGASPQDMIKQIEKFAAPKLKQQLRGITDISDTIYNWHLNNKN